MEQRSKFGGKPKQQAIAKACKNKVRKKHGKSPLTKEYRGVLKARVNKLYGGDVTCDKVGKLKARRNATKRDVQLANWFINMQDCKRT